MRIEANICYLAVKPTKPRKNKQDTFPINSLLQTRNINRKKSTDTTLATFTTRIRNQSSSEIILKNNSISNYTRRTALLIAVKNIIY